MVTRTARRSKGCRTKQKPHRHTAPAPSPSSAARQAIPHSARTSSPQPLSSSSPPTRALPSTHLRKSRPGAKSSAKVVHAASGDCRAAAPTPATATEARFPRPPIHRPSTSCGTPSARENVVDVMCVTLPVQLSSRLQRSADAATEGHQLLLQQQGLTRMPCLHAPAKESEAPVPSLESAHGSGDVLASHVRILSLRENAISRLLSDEADDVAATMLPSPTAEPHSTTLDRYSNLASLDLSHNALLSIAGVEMLRCLRVLRLANNKLSSLAPLWASPHVANLEVLDVSANKLTVLLTTEDLRVFERHGIGPAPLSLSTKLSRSSSLRRGESTVSTPKRMRLRRLYACNNQLRELPDSVSTFGGLVDLRLRQNRIAVVPDGFPSPSLLPYLRQVDLSMNPLPSGTMDAVAARVAMAARASPCQSTMQAPEKMGREGDAGCGCIASPMPAKNRPAVEREEEEGRRSAPATPHPTSATTPTNHLPSPSAAVAAAATVAAVPSGVQTPGLAIPEALHVRVPPLERVASAVSGRALAERQRSAGASAASPSRSPCGASSFSMSLLAPGTAAWEAASAVERFGENCYAVDLRRGAEVLRRQLLNLRPAASRPCSSSAATRKGMQAAYKMTETARRRCGTAAASPSKLFEVDDEPCIASLRRCLPAWSLSYTDGTHARSPPILVLHGILVGIAADAEQLLLYEVLAHHIVQSCLCTPPPAVKHVEEESHAPLETVRTGRSAASPSLHQRCVESNGGRGSTARPTPLKRRGGVRGVSRRLRFTAPLHVVHVIDCSTAAPLQASSTTSSAAAMWGYVAWRQRWEAALACRPFEPKDMYVCELGDDHALVQPGAGEGSPAYSCRYGRRRSFTLPFGDAVPCMLEWQRLQLHRPALYHTLPVLWDRVYELLRSANVEAVPPILPWASTSADTSSCHSSLWHDSECTSSDAGPTASPYTAAQLLSLLHEMETDSLAGTPRGHSATAPSELLPHHILSYIAHRQHHCDFLIGAAAEAVTAVAAGQVPTCDMLIYPAHGCTRAKDDVSRPAGGSGEGP